MEITLIRHTRVAVPPGTCYGWSDVPVADTFEQEAEVVRQRLHEMPFDAVYTSPLKRARILAEYCGFANAIADPRLREMNMG
ncbi:MAG: histidine phosphatase family protein, partial [Prevotella sp.]|nr:histidine phosphatase family protein [Prevotella sp.]